MAWGMNEKLFQKAKKVIPGAVNSPVRNFARVGGTPLFIKRGKGAKIWDEDNREYIDYLGSWGPLILGHSHPRIIEAVTEALRDGTSFGMSTRKEVELAELITEAIPSVEMLRLVNSGTEAVMSALRVARGYTNRDKIVKFAGCYHGHVDYLLAGAGSGAAFLSHPNSPGIPEKFTRDTLVLPYNDLGSVSRAVEKYSDQIAAIIVEPVAGNMGVIPPESGFLQGLRKICNEFQILLIFDEVITGFRVSYGGAQALYGVYPDITCLGKIIGGGFPVGAYGGKKEIMEQVAPVGDVYQAGTLSGNPVATTAGLETLRILSQSKVYEELDEKTRTLCQSIKKVATDSEVKVIINRVGSMFSIFFTSEPVNDFAGVKNSNQDLFKKFFWGMFEKGVLIPPSPFESNFVSLAHTSGDIEKTIRAVQELLPQLH